MTRITNTIDIDASTHEVYSALRALDAYPTWLRHSTVYRGTSAVNSPGGGSLTYQDSTTVGRMRGELVDDEPDHTLTFHQAKPSGTLDAVIVYTVDAAGTQTHVTRTGDMTTHGMLKVVQPILLRMASAESGRTMTALKAHVEHGTADRG